MSRFKDPLKEHREMMASIADPLKEHREMMASITDPLKEHREMMASIADPLKEHREMMASIADPLKEHREMMASITDPLKEHREMMASFSNPMKELRASLAGLSEPFSTIQSAITNSPSLKSMKDIVLEIQPNIEVNSDGVASLSNKRIAVAELQKLSDTIFHNSSLAESRSLEESINNLVNEIKSQKDPLTQKLLMYFIYPLIVVLIASFINPLVDHRVKSYLTSNKRALAKELKSSVNSSVSNKEILSTLRYVSADTLNVRASASVKSKTIGYLRFSSAVLVIKKEKSWTLIEWSEPETNVKIIGWVFSRYLAKFQ